MRILLLAPHPFFQARGTPIAVRTVLEFLSERGDSVDVLTYSEGADVEIRNCRIHRIPRVPGLRNIRAGFSVKKVICDALMVVACLGMVRRTRYDLIHAVEESAFIASAMRTLSGVPYVYEMRGLEYLMNFYNNGDGRVRWLETQSPQPPARNSYRWTRDWEYVAQQLERKGVA